MDYNTISSSGNDGIGVSHVSRGIEDSDEESLGEDLQLTKRVIKLVSGQFDLESIRFVNCSTFETIKKIQNLTYCKNLEVLNLSQNQIKKIEGLDTLEKLRILNLSHNLIQKIEGLENLKSLQILQLQKNLIVDVDNLWNLKNNQNLKDVNFKENPISQKDDFVPTIKKVLKNIALVNGEHILLALPVVSKRKSIDVPDLPKEVDSWLTKEHLEYDNPLPSFEEDGNTIRMKLNECKKIIARADSVIESFMML